MEEVFENVDDADSYIPDEMIEGDEDEGYEVEIPELSVVGKKMKIIDGVIKEPLGGAHNDIDLAAKRLKKVILDDISELEKVDPDKRVLNRINKFSEMGVIDD